MQTTNAVRDSHNEPKTSAVSLKPISIPLAHFFVESSRIYAFLGCEYWLNLYATKQHCRPKQ